MCISSPPSNPCFLPVILDNHVENRLTPPEEQYKDLDDVKKQLHGGALLDKKDVFCLGSTHLLFRM